MSRNKKVQMKKLINKAIYKHFIARVNNTYVLDITDNTTLTNIEVELEILDDNYENFEEHALELVMYYDANVLRWNWRG